MSVEADAYSSTVTHTHSSMRLIRGMAIVSQHSQGTVLPQLIMSCAQVTQPVMAIISAQESNSKYGPLPASLEGNQRQKHGHHISRLLRPIALDDLLGALKGFDKNSHGSVLPQLCIHAPEVTISNAKSTLPNFVSYILLPFSCLNMGPVVFDLVKHPLMKSHCKIL